MVNRNQIYKDTDFTKEWLKNLFDKTTYCKYCGVKMEKFPTCKTIDHIIPISREGKHIKSNVQVICWACNLKKKAHLEEEFLKMLTNLKADMQEG